MFRFWPFILCIAAPVDAQEMALRKGDRVLTAKELVALTSGNTLTFYDNGQSRFSAGGSYSYSYASGATAFGRYEIGSNGQICLFYRNGFSRCDVYVRNGGRLYLLTSKGERFPTRLESD